MANQFSATKNPHDRKLEEEIKAGRVHRGFHPPGHDPDYCEACYLHEQRAMKEEDRDDNK